LNNTTEKPPRNWIPMACFAFCVALTLVALVLVYRCEKCTPQDRLTLLVGYGTLILVFFFGLMVLLEIAAGRIDLSHLLSETGPDGKTGQASLSRFQLLIFTLVIAFSLFLITVAKNQFPAIPTEILTLLGISASTYAVSKGIQASTTSPTGPDGQGGTADQVTSTTQDPATGKITTRLHSPASGQTTTTVHDPATGQTTTTVHQPTTVTTSTTVNPPPPTPTA
jgi:hypothetical protein